MEVENGPLSSKSRGASTFMLVPSRLGFRKFLASQTNHFYAAITAEKSQCLANLGRSFGAKTTVGGV